MKKRETRDPCRAIAAAAQDQDAQDQDARYFQEHPTCKGYTRTATDGELQATGLPLGTLVYVALIGPATRARAFLPPDARRN